MTCICGSERLMNLYGHAKDLQNWRIPHLHHEDDGYAPKIPNVCEGDDIDFTFCLDCGHIQNFKQISDEFLIELLGIEETDSALGDEYE